MENTPVASPERLIAAILDFFGGQDLLTKADIRAQLQREVDDAGVDAVIGLKARLAADDGWAYYPRDPLAQRIHQVLADRFLTGESALRGLHHLQGLDGSPIVLCANHLSYADANVMAVLLERAGGAALANRLTAIAGPKVFTSRERRFSSLCFGTVKVPQSAEVASGEAVLNPREVARAARRAIDVAHERLRQGDMLLLFPEGTRSRTAAMQRLLAAAARYLELSEAWVVPAGVVGPEVLFAIEDARLRPARVVVEIGRPVKAATLIAQAGGDRRVVMDAIGLATADLLPMDYRGVYAHPADFAEADQVLRAAHANARSAAAADGSSPT